MLYDINECMSDSIEEQDEIQIICKRCGEDFKRKDTLRNHWMKKKPCQPHIYDLSCVHLMRVLYAYEQCVKQMPRYCTQCYKVFEHRYLKSRHQCTNVIDENSKTFIENHIKKILSLELYLFGKTTPGLLSFGSEILYRDVMKFLGFKQLYALFLEMNLVDLIKAVFLNGPQKFRFIIFDKQNELFKVHKKGFWVQESCEDVIDYLYDTGLLIFRSFYILCRDADCQIFKEARPTKINLFLNSGHEFSMIQTKEDILDMFYKS